MQRAHRQSLLLLLVVGVLASTACKPTRPDFDVDAAHAEIAGAFKRPVGAVAIMGDARGEEEATWIVDFTVDGFEPFLQAKFVGADAAWHLDGVRERPSGAKETPWSNVGVMLGRFKGAIVVKAEETERRMRELGAFIERHAIEHGGRFPNTNLDGVRKLVLGAGYIEEAKWHHGTDGWGGAMAYHGAADGNAYIIVAKGADGNWDQPLETYFQNTDQGLEIYAGPTADADKDIVWASGTFVQTFRPD